MGATGVFKQRNNMIQCAGMFLGVRSGCYVKNWEGTKVDTRAPFKAIIRAEMLAA